MEDVGLAGPVEDLAHRLALEDRVQADQQDQADLLLVQLRGEGGTALQRIALPLQHRQRGLVVGIAQRVLGPRGRGQPPRAVR